MNAAMNYCKGPRPTAFYLLALLFFPAVLFAIDRVAPTNYPQKVRTFYKITDPAVPALLHSNAVPLAGWNITAAVRSIDGALWLGSTQGIVRLDSSAPIRDQHQYLAGQRYLPDDVVEQLLPDENGGIWARTRTGVSHI